MFDISNKRKSVMIREEKQFFSNPQFGTKFPKQLSGIIHPSEFQQSIANINKASRPTLFEKLLIIVLFLCSLIGLLVFIGGISVIWLSLPALWIPLMSIGFCLFMAFFVIALFVSSRIYRSCDTRLDKAVDVESMKYSMKLPVPTRWRLDMTIYTRRLSMTAPTEIQYFLLIEIGQGSGLKIGNNRFNSNLNVPKPTLHINQQYPTSHVSQPNLPMTKSLEPTLHKDKHGSIP